MTYNISYLIKTLCFILTFFALVLCGFLFQKHSPEIIRWVNELGWFAPVLFLIIYCLASILLLPTMVLTLAGGAIFGPIIGTILNLFGATFGAALSFLITRHLIYDWFSQKKGPKLNKLIAGVDQKGWLFVAALRVFPIFPFNLVNYGLGITGIRFRLYVITTFIFLIPTEIIYTYFGFAGLDILSRPGQLYKNGGILLGGMMLLFFGVFKLIKRK